METLESQSNIDARDGYKERLLSLKHKRTKNNTRAIGRARRLNPNLGNLRPLPILQGAPES